MFDITFIFIIVHHEIWFVNTDDIISNCSKLQPLWGVGEKKIQVIFSPILTVKIGETVPRENLLEFTISDGQEWWNYTARKTCKNNVSPVSTVGAGENNPYWASTLWIDSHRQARSLCVWKLVWAWDSTESWRVVSYNPSLHSYSSVIYWFWGWIRSLVSANLTPDWENLC